MLKAAQSDCQPQSQRPRAQTQAVQYYDARAAEYDDLYTGRGQFSISRREIEGDCGLIAPMLREFGAGRVLDVACGTSFFAKWYSENAESIVGVDISPRMLIESRMRHRSLAARARLVRADGFSLPFAAHSFDRCFAGFLLSHLADVDILALLHDIKPLLKAAGQLAIVDSAWTEIRKKQGRRRSSVQTRTLDDGRKFEVFKRYFAPEELQDLLRRAGFSICSLVVGQVFLCAICSLRSD